MESKSKGELIGTETVRGEGGRPVKGRPSRGSLKQTSAGMITMALGRFEDERNHFSARGRDVIKVRCQPFSRD